MNNCRKEVIKNKPRISLILVTMNRKDILERCLESIGLQKFAHYEIIVVDNAFSDRDNYKWNNHQEEYNTHCPNQNRLFMAKALLQLPEI